jgi:hypothetical protein
VLLDQVDARAKIENWRVDYNEVREGRTSPAACEDIPEIPVRNGSIRRIIWVFGKLTQDG